MQNYRDHDAEKIERRKWTDIRGEWANYVPSHSSPWPKPEHEIYELSSLEQSLTLLGGPKNNDSTFEEEIEGLRKAVLHEAVFSVHKGACILRVAAHEGSHGHRTWARSSAYHAAFFAMQGLLGLLGVVLFRARDRQSEYQVDLWAPRRGQRRRTPGPGESAFGTRIIRRSRRAEHKELWGVFSRVLRVTDVEESIWPLHDRDPLKTLDPGSFSHVRHCIHYRSAGWLFDDVDRTDSTDTLDQLPVQVREFGYAQDHEHCDFPLALGLHIVSRAVALLEDLGARIPVIQQEHLRVEEWLSPCPWKLANAFNS